MRTAPVKAIALPAVYRGNLEFPVSAHACYRFAHARTPRVLHFSAFIFEEMEKNSFSHSLHAI